MVEALLSLLRGEPYRLNDSDARELLALSDRTGATLLLRGKEGLPSWLVDAIELRCTQNAKRREKLLAEYRQVAQALQAAGVDHILLKGFTHEHGFGIDGSLRVQYDLDLLCKPEQTGHAGEILGELGYLPFGDRERSELHDRPWIKPFTWQWRRDYYDPDMPVAVELHRTLWSGVEDRLPINGLDAVWDRRVRIDGMPALGEADRVGFAALHVLRHILHNNARICHVWELGRMLEARLEDRELWAAWRQQHASARRLQTVAMRFPVAWFGARWSDSIESEWQSLGHEIHQWFERSALAPAINLETPNKDVLWLHRRLVENRFSQAALVLQKLLPLKRPERGRELERASYHLKALLRSIFG